GGTVSAFHLMCNNSLRNLFAAVCRTVLVLMIAQSLGWTQGAHDAAAPPPPGASCKVCKKRPVPQFEDITAKTGIKFQHLSSPDKKYILESMSGGVLLVDYDRDGWPDIYFTNAPDVAMAIKGTKAHGALYHNNHDGTFTDVTDKAGV